MGQLHWLTADDLPLAQTSEQLTQGLRLLHPITLHLSAGMQAVILLAVDRHHLHVRRERGDSRKEALAVVALGVELIRWLVGGRHQHHALLHHQTEQAAEQHGIADIADEQLVETQHAHLTPQLLGQQAQRVGIASELKLPAMHPLHEVMKMLPPRRHAQSVEKAVHQPGLATPDRPPEVDAKRPFTSLDSLMTVLQRLDRTALRGIDHEASSKRTLIDGLGRVRQGLWGVQRSTSRPSSNCRGQSRRVNTWPCSRTRRTSSRSSSQISQWLRVGHSSSLSATMPLAGMP